MHTVKISMLVLHIYRERKMEKERVMSLYLHMHQL